MKANATLGFEFEGFPSGMQVTYGLHPWIHASHRGPAELWPFSWAWITAGDLLQRTDIIMYNTQRNNWRYHTSCLMHWLGSLSPSNSVSFFLVREVTEGAERKGAEQNVKPNVLRTIHYREPVSRALDEGSVILVSSVAHLRDGNRAFKVWNEHSSSVLPSRWGKGIKQNKTKSIWWWHFQ